MTTRKSTTTITLMAVAVAAATVGIVAVAQAHGPGGPHRWGFGPGGRDFAERLGLSEEQQAQIKAIHEKNRESMKPLFEKARQAHEAFRQALETPNADAATVGRAALAMHAAEKQVRAAHQAVFEQVKSVLTPEQLAKLEKDRARRHGPGEGREEEDGDHEP